MTDGAGAIIFEGIVSIEAALRADSRPIARILIRDDPRQRYDQAISRLARLAEGRAIPVERVDEATIDIHAQGHTHGGVIAFVGERRAVPLDSLLANAADPFIVMLDGVEDPYNYGQAIRAFYAAGVDGLVIRGRDWTAAAGVIARASAGASELLPTAIAESAEEAAIVFRGGGLRLAVADKTRATPVFNADLRGGLFLVIGGEKRGITRSFADAADVRVRIPYGRDFESSLGTTAAAAVLAFEVMRQRGIKNIPPAR